MIRITQIYVYVLFFFFFFFFLKRLPLMLHPSDQSRGKILSIEKPPVGRRKLKN